MQLPNQKPKDGADYEENALFAAKYLWNKFCTDEKPVPGSGFFDSADGILAFLLQFAQCCAKEVGIPQDIRIDWWKGLKNPPLNETVKDITPMPVSWLYHESNDVPVILIDRELLSKQIAYLEEVDQAKLKPARLRPIISRIVLHELGHLVLHWQSLHPRADGKYVKDSPIEFEEHAWLFAGMIVGLETGRIAKESKTLLGFDNAWRQTIREGYTIPL